MIFGFSNILVSILNGYMAKPRQGDTMKGVAAFIKEHQDGSTRLILNDIEASSDTDSPDWKHIVVFTSNSYNSKSFKELSLSKE